LCSARGPWLGLGPIAIALRSGPWPWHLGPLTRSHPGRARLRVDLHVAYRAAAGRDEPLAWADEHYVGPGFVLEGEREGGYRAVVEGPDAIGGALAALMIDLGRRASLVVLHAASLVFRGRAWCLAGPSGVGKSSWVRRHERRALGSNAALLWLEAGAWWAQALPLTGKGDAAVSPQPMPLGGLWFAGRSRRPRAPVEGMAWLASAAATARGLGPRLDLLEALAREQALGGLRAPGARLAREQIIR
jgi:hypothetical protein